MRTIRADGSVEDSPLHSSCAEDSITADEVPLLTHEERLRRIEFLAANMANQVAQHMQESICKTLDAHDQIVDLRGQPLGPDAFLAVFEKIQMEFDEAGNPEDLCMTPPMAEQWISVQQQLESDASLRQRFDDLLERKRGEWRDREAARKLVG